MSAIITTYAYGGEPKKPYTRYMPVTDLVLVAHNVRSSHNVGSLLRTADGLGVQTVYLTGYTPYPASQNDDRLPHVQAKINRQIHKTALGAELSQIWQKDSNVTEVIHQLKQAGYVVIALEQTATAVDLSSFRAPPKACLILGNEVTGIESKLLDLCDLAIEIPMKGQKESFNVAQAAAMALYSLLNVN